jgi:hypothetical protein
MPVGTKTEAYALRLGVVLVPASNRWHKLREVVGSRVLLSRACNLGRALCAAFFFRLRYVSQSPSFAATCRAPCVDEVCHERDR